MKILTWNVNWKMMLKRENMDNVVATITKDVYDLIAIQEAKNWETIWRKSNLQMGYIHHYITHNGYQVDLVTFYNPKYKVLAVKTGQIIAGRPYHIIYFTYRNANYIFINIHNGHGVLKSTLERALNTEMYDVVDLSVYSNTNFKNVNEMPTRKMVKPTNPHIIAVGDFNDDGYHYWKKLKICNIIKADNPPPQTRGVYSLDYVLISDNLQYAIENRVVKPVLPASDHLPVMSIIRKIQLK